MTKKKSIPPKSNSPIRLLLIGVLITGFSIYEFATILVPKSSLAKIEGTLRDADTYVTTVTDNRGHESQKSELIFYLNDRPQKFYLVENIGDEYENEKQEEILHGLKRSDVITVWVRKDEINKFEPKIFQIDGNQATLLDFETVQAEIRPFSAFLLLLGFASFVAYFWLQFPEQFSKFLLTIESKV